MDDTIGSPLGEPGYRLIVADTQINKPPDLWTKRVPAKFKDRAPHMERFEQGDAWVLEGVKDPINFGSNASAGIPLADRSAWVRWEDIRAGGYDPKARLLEMDADLVDAAVIYPTPRISHLVIANPDPEFRLAMVQAYNDWLSEYCEHDPSRLGGIRLVPNRGAPHTRGEHPGAAHPPGRLAGRRGCYPHGDLNLAEEDDPVWQEIAGGGMRLHIHGGLVNEYP